VTDTLLTAEGVATASPDTTSCQPSIVKVALVTAVGFQLSELVASVTVLKCNLRVNCDVALPWCLYNDQIYLTQ
jgi:hypothetical protein